MSNATLLWYDGFDTSEYTVGDPLGGQSGGGGGGMTFFTDPWEAATYPAIQYNTEASATGLSRPGVSSLGGSAASKPISACQHGYPGCSENRTSRLMTDPWAAFTNPDGTFYVSFLVDFGLDGGDPGRNPHHKTFEMHVNGLDDSQRQLMLGLSSFVGEFQANQGLSLAARDSNASAWEYDPLIVDGINPHIRQLAFQGTHLLVLKFEMSNSNPDVISAFLDPVGGIEPAPNAQVTVGEFLADRMSSLAQFSYDFAEEGIFDEIRVGTTFGDVASNTLVFAIPEPCSFTLVGCGMLGMLLTVRRNRNWMR